MRKGFTLIELMTAAVLGLAITGILYNIYVETGKKEKEAQVKTNMYMIQLGAEDFAVLTEGIYATDCGTTVGAVRTLVYGGTDPLAYDFRSMCGVSQGLQPIGPNNLVSSMMTNPIVGANMGFVSIPIDHHDPCLSGTVGYASYDVNACTPAPLGCGVSYEISADGIDDLIPLRLVSGR